MNRALLTVKWLMVATVCSFFSLLLAPGDVWAQTATPPAPTITSLIPRDGALLVQWFNYSNPSGSGITAHDLRYIRSDADATIDGNWTILSAVTRVASFYYVQGLTNGVEYHVQLRAVNAVGPGTRVFRLSHPLTLSVALSP